MAKPKMLSTVDEVVNDIIAQLDEERREKLHIILDDDMPTDDDDFARIQSQISIGRQIRNTYGLWQDNEDLAKDCLRVDPAISTGSYRLWREEMDDKEFEEAKQGLLLEEVHPDDASSVIQIVLLRRLREISINGYEFN